MYESIPKPPILLRAIPGHLTRVKLRTVGNLTQDEGLKRQKRLGKEKSKRKKMIICLYKRAKFADVLKCLRCQEIREMIIRRIFKYIVYLIIFIEITKLRKKGLRDFGYLSYLFI